MGSTALKVTAVVLVLLTLLLAVLGFMVSRNYASRTLAAEAAASEARDAQKETIKTMAVVATKPLPAYRVIARESLQLVPVAVVPAGYFSRIDAVAGRTPLTAIDAGQPVTKRYFKEANGLAQAIPEGHQALALEINEVIAAGGFIRPGDLVDVLVYLRNGPGIELPQARVLLPAVRVLAFEDKLIDRPQELAETEDASANAAAQRKRQRTVVLSVPTAATTRVLLGAALGEVRLALRADTPPAAGAIEPTLDPNLKPGLPVTSEDLAQAAKPKPVPQVVPKPRPTVEIFHGASAEQVAQ